MNEKTQGMAGFAQVDITPDFPVDLIGCAREDDGSTGVLHPLCAQVLLLSLAGRYACLVAIDSLGLTTALADDVRSAIAQRLGTAMDTVMLNFSHTHSAPAPLSPNNGGRYFALLRDRVLEGVEAALQGMLPCRVGWAVTSTAIPNNRRDGCDAVDDRLAALRVMRQDTGAPIVTVLRVSAHANILMKQSNAITSDYFGLARDALPQVLDGPAMLLQGASGNLKAVGVDKMDGGTLDDARRIVGLLAEEAARLRFAPQPLTRLCAYDRPLLYHADVPDAAEAERIAETVHGARRERAAGWLAECARLRAAGITEQTVPGRMGFLWINEGCLCGVAEEIFCEIALDTAAQAGAELLLLSGYTNGCTGYLPGEAEWLKGGYEVLDSYLTYYPFHGHVMPYRKETAAELVAMAVDEWCNHW